MEPLSRRQLLGLGATLATGLVVGCQSDSADKPHVPGRFAGDPGGGRLYYGASLPSTRSLPGWESALGATLSVHRSYFTPGGTAKLVAQVDDDHRNRRLPHVSIKPPSSWSDVSAGDEDAWLDRILEELAAGALPVFLTVHHEPENDAGTFGNAPAEYVAMQERVIRRTASVAPLVTVVPVLQHWSFDPVNPDARPEPWLVPAAAVFGVDLYNPWSPTTGGAWTSFADKLGNVLPHAEGRPVVIGEYGCHADPSRPERAVRWMRAAFRDARDAGVVSMSYFNSHRSFPDGGWELTPELDEVFRTKLHDSSVARADEGAS